jgi:hypothetical protein
MLEFDGLTKRYNDTVEMSDLSPVGVDTLAGVLLDKTRKGVPVVSPPPSGPGRAA